MTGYIDKSLISCAFPTWWGCRSVRRRRRGSGWSGRTQGVGAPWRSRRRPCTIGRMTVRYDNPLLWVTGGRCVPAWPGDQDMFLSYLIGIQLVFSMSKHNIFPKSINRIINESLLNLLPVSPFWLAFPFGRAARVTNKQMTSDNIY